MEQKRAKGKSSGWPGCQVSEELQRYATFFS